MSRRIPIMQMDDAAIFGEVDNMCVHLADGRRANISWVLIDMGDST